MVDRITSRMGTVTRPGVFVSQTSVGGSQPLSNHAVGYLYATVDEGYDSLRYSDLVPYEPTQIFSLTDYVAQSGGIPTSGGARISYDAVNAFFQNVGNSGILFVTRVVPTPETVLNVTSEAGFGHNYFAIKINGKYIGDIPLEQVDEDLDEIFVIRTTGIDELDNALDIHRYLDSDTEFNYSFKTEQDEADVLAKRLRIFSKDPRETVRVEAFKAYRSVSPLDSEVDLLPYIRSYAPSKDVVVKLRSRNLTTGKEIVYVDGDSLVMHKESSAYPALNSLVIGSAAVDKDDFNTVLLSYIENILGKGSLATGEVIAISAPSVAADIDTDFVGYISVTTGGDTADAVLPTTNSTAIVAGNLDARSGYLPDSVQVVYLEIAGENRVVVLNGNGVQELGDDLVRVVTEIFEEKGLSPYFSITNETKSSPVNTTYLPNNGYSLSSAAAHGKPLIKPALNQDLLLSGTVSSSGAALTGVGTKFLTEIWPGATVFIKTRKYEVATVTSDTAATLTRTPSTAFSAETLYLDSSEANGFYSFDYLVKVRITSKNGSKPPVYPGLTRSGLIESNVAYLPSPDEEHSYSTYKYSSRAKAQDFVYAITNSLERKIDVQPGLIMAPEAFATIVEGVDLNTRSQAQDLRLRVASAIATAAEGRLGPDGIAPSQHIGLIDCGGDVTTLQQSRDELVNLRSKVGSAFGHLYYYAPYVINGVGNRVPLSPYVAGVACSRYVNEGFQQAPAGARYPLRDANGLTFTISSQQQEVTYGLGLNPARELPNRGIVIWGARSISSNPLFKYLSTRAILNVLLDILNRSFDDLLFEQVDSPSALFSRVKGVATTILQQFYNRGAFFGDRPEQAYKVICDYSNNSDETLEAGSLACDIFVATSPTLERLFISVVRTPAGQIAQINDRFDRNLNAIQGFQNATQIR